MAVEFREAVLLPPTHRNSVHNSTRVEKQPQHQVTRPNTQGHKANQKCTWFGQGLSMINKAGFSEFNEFGFNFGFEKAGNAGVANYASKPASIIGNFDFSTAVPLKTEDIQKNGTVTVPPVVDENAIADETVAEKIFEEVPVITEPEAGSEAGDNSGKQEQSKGENPFA